MGRPEETRTPQPERRQRPPAAPARPLRLASGVSAAASPQGSPAAAQSGQAHQDGRQRISNPQTSQPGPGRCWLNCGRPRQTDRQAGSPSGPEPKGGLRGGWPPRAVGTPPNHATQKRETAARGPRRRRALAIWGRRGWSWEMLCGYAGERAGVWGWHGFGVATVWPWAVKGFFLLPEERSERFSIRQWWTGFFAYYV
jgi:hypothetical protein